MPNFLSGTEVRIANPFNVNVNEAGSAINVTVPNTGARRCLVAFVAYFDGSLTVSDILAGGTSMTQQIASGTASTTGRIECWTLTETAGLTIGSSISVAPQYSGGGTMDEIDTFVIAYNNVDQTTPVGETPTDASENSSTDTLTATLDTGDLLVGGTYFFQSGSSVNLSVTTGTERLDGNSDTASSGSGIAEASGGTIVWTYSAGADGISCGIELNDDPGGGASPITGSGPVTFANGSSIYGIGVLSGLSFRLQQIYRSLLYANCQPKIIR